MILIFWCIDERFCSDPDDMNEYQNESVTIMKGMAEKFLTIRNDTKWFPSLMLEFYIPKRHLWAMEMTLFSPENSGDEKNCLKYLNTSF